LKAKSQFEQLIEGLSEKNAVSSVTEAWIARNAVHHMGVAVILRLFTHELIEGAAAENSSGSGHRDLCCRGRCNGTV
jgi:hypothetical protein